jgi:hypothetical protein
MACIYIRVLVLACLSARCGQAIREMRVQDQGGSSSIAASPGLTTTHGYHPNQC